MNTETDDMGKFSRDKGARWERELVHLFGAAVPHARVQRGYQYRDGQEVPDVDAPGVWVEAKAGKRPNIPAALWQAHQASRHTRWPVAVCKQDRQRPTVTMYLDDWLAMYGQWYAGRVQNYGPAAAALEAAQARVRELEAELAMTAHQSPQNPRRMP